MKCRVYKNIKNLTPSLKHTVSKCISNSAYLSFSRPLDLLLITEAPPEFFSNFEETLSHLYTYA